jgi:hypothetical protein
MVVAKSISIAEGVDEYLARRVRNRDKRIDIEEWAYDAGFKKNPAQVASKVLKRLGIITTNDNWIVTGEAYDGRFDRIAAELRAEAGHTGKVRKGVVDFCDDEDGCCRLNDLYTAKKFPTAKVDVIRKAIWDRAYDMGEEPVDLIIESEVDSVLNGSEGLDMPRFRADMLPIVMKGAYGNGARPEIDEDGGIKAIRAKLNKMLEETRQSNEEWTAKVASDRANADAKAALVERENAQAALALAETTLALAETTLVEKRLEREADLIALGKMRIDRAELPIKHAIDDDAFTMDGDVTVGALPIVIMRDGMKVEVDFRVRMRPDGRYNGKPIADSLGNQLRNILDLKAVKAFIESERERGIALSEIVVYDDGVPWLSDALVSAILWAIDPDSASRYMSRILRAPSGEDISRTTLIEAHDEAIERMSVAHNFPFGPLVKMPPTVDRTPSAWYEGIYGIQGDGFALAVAPLSSGKVTLEILKPSSLALSLEGAIEMWEVSTTMCSGERSLLVVPFERDIDPNDKKMALDVVSGKLNRTDGIVFKDAYDAWVVKDDIVRATLKSVAYETFDLLGVSGTTMKANV